MAIYARVSTNDKGQDTENQLRELRRFAADSGWTVGHEYVDHVTGSGKRERGQFDAMLKDATRRKFRAVLVWALDRLTREGIEKTFGYVRHLKDNGVDFVSYTEAHFRTTGPAGSLMLAVAAWIAEQERKRISDRTKAGMETARLKGKVIGRPAAKVNAAAVMALHAEGKGVMKIAAELGGVSRETVRRILKREGR